MCRKFYPPAKGTRYILLFVMHFGSVLSARPRLSTSTRLAPYIRTVNAPIVLRGEIYGIDTLRVHINRCNASMRTEGRARTCEGERRVARRMHPVHAASQQYLDAI